MHMHMHHMHMHLHLHLHNMHMHVHVHVHVHVHRVPRALRQSNSIPLTHRRAWVRQTEKNAQNRWKTLQNASRRSR